ncbi:MAG: hypothetical protein LBS18_07855 [Clostridiales bacterium]|jgi:hypothetical protein|nr:hypothetical protein [Clostridiales bacterium]
MEASKTSAPDTGQEHKQGRDYTNALLIVIAFALCGVIFLLVSAAPAAQAPVAVVTISHSPAPATIAPAPGGVRAKKLLHDFFEQGLALEGYDEETYTGKLYVDAHGDDYNATITLLMRNGYAQGFRMEMPLYAEPAKPGKNATAFERGQYAMQLDLYENAAAGQGALLQKALYAALLAIDYEGAVPLSSVSAWETAVTHMIKDRKPITEKASPFLFTGSIADGQIRVSLSR